MCFMILFVGVNDKLTLLESMKAIPETPAGGDLGLCAAPHVREVERGLDQTYL